MIITILDGQVAAEDGKRLEEAYEQYYKHPPKGLLQSYLIQCKDQDHLWKLISFWHSSEEHDWAHVSHQTEICAQMFCEFGSVPGYHSFKVVEAYQRV